MLTGDKMETAENIAKSCRLYQDDMQKFSVSTMVAKSQDLSETLMSYYEEIKKSIDA
jgi:magnesium-transporting ATPase (P-type)